MRVYHATTLKAWKAIQEDGWFLASKATNRRKAVWFASQSHWAFQHVVRRLRAGQRVEDLILLAVDMPKARLTKHAEGLWYCWEDVPVARVLSVTGYATITQKVRA